VNHNLIQDAVRGQLSLPAVPRVVRQLVTHLKDPSVSLDGIVNDLEQDPVLAARTLQLANSPYYSGRRSLSSIGDAVAVLGISALQRLVLTVGLSSVFVEVPGVNLRQFWLDATVAATTARMVAQMSDMTREDADAAHLAGLLHASGHLILCMAYPAEATQAFASHRCVRGAELAAAELQAFGMIYPAVGAAWVEKMGFPSVVENAIRHHLDPRGSQAGGLASVVNLAVQVAASVGAGDSVEEALEKVDLGLLDLVALDHNKFEQDLHSSYDDLRSLSPPV
jgi:HD-like signal output (HDOD) protein